MNTNNRLCPNCRSPLNSTSCKRCGFKQKTLKIVETQDYSRCNVVSKIQHVHHASKHPKQFTERQKLVLYLKEYQQLIKKAARKIVQKEDSIQLSRHFMEEVKFLWEGYLIKRKQAGLSFSGMFKKYICVDSNHKQKSQKSEPSKIQNKEQQHIKMEGTQQQVIKEEQQPTLKRKRGRKAGTKANQFVSVMTQFRCFYNVSVKPLIAQSIQQRKINDNNCMTACQKSFLAYLLTVREVDMQFIQFASSKYLKMVMGLWINPVRSNFIKEKDIEHELKKRHCSLLKKKDDSAMLVLLVDLLICWNNERVQSNIVSIREMMQWYADCQQGSEIIDKIKLQLDQGDHQEEDNFNIPIINYQLIYSIVYLAACRVGLCLSVGEIVTGCSRLEIGRITIQNEDNVFLPAVTNEQSITVAKTRRTAHLLAYYMGITPICCIAKWSEKWCSKFGLQKYIPKVFLLNSLMFEQIKHAKTGKMSLHEQILNNGKLIKYHRYIELQQDIASLAGIMLFLKLSNGLTEYPYLIHFTPNQLSQHYTINQLEIKILKDLMMNRQLTIKNTSNNIIRTQKLPHVYEEPISVLNIAKTLSNINKNDKEIGRNSIQRQIIRLRNLSHLNYVPCLQLIDHFRKVKEDKEQQQKQKKGIIVQLRFDQITHKQRVREHIDINKNLKAKKDSKELDKPEAQLNCNLIRQLQCIVGKYDQVIEEVKQQPPKICLIDDPSSNYELMYDYGDNLMLTGRHRQLYFMQMLCLNLCTLSEMSGWITRYESVLKQYEMN